MSAAEILQELEKLVPSERGEVVRKALLSLYPKNGRSIDRLLRRLENPEVSEETWRAVESAEEKTGSDSPTTWFCKPTNAA